MLSSYRDLSSITETLEEVAEDEEVSAVIKHRRSSRYSLEKTQNLELTDEERKPVALWRKAAFGFGNFSRYTVIGIQAYFLNVFLLEVAGIGTFWAGNILLVKQIYDGFTDPLVGGISDSFNTRFGRRKPWILLASIPSGVFWILQWYIPGFVDDSVALTITYFIIILLFFSTMNTFVSVPYNAMVPDVAVNYDDRTAVVLFQEVFGLSAVIIFSYFQAEAVEFFKEDDNENLVDYEKGYLCASFITVWAVVIPMIFAVIFVKERPPKESDEKKGLISWFGNFLKTLFKSLLFKEFALIVIVFVLCMIAVYLFVNNFVLYIKYVLVAEDQTSFMMLAVQATATLSIFFWAFLSKRIGKKRTFFIGTVLWIAGSIVIFFINSNDIKVFYVVCIIRALGSGVGYLIPLAILPDVIELDRMKNGVAREGVLYSLMILLQKTGVGLAITGSNYVLGIAGYESPDKETVAQEEDSYQPKSVLLAFRILMCVVPIICLILALICISFIKVSKEYLEEYEAQKQDEEKDLHFKPKVAPKKDEHDLLLDH